MKEIKEDFVKEKSGKVVKKMLEGECVPCKKTDKSEKILKKLI